MEDKDKKRKVNEDKLLDVLTAQGMPQPFYYLCDYKQQCCQLCGMCSVVKFCYMYEFY